jgi:hypothetical protein
VTCETGAQLSAHFSLGLTACKRSNSFDTYMKAWESGFKDPDVLAVARKVSVIEIPGPDSSETRAVPGQDPKAPPLTVKTKDGKTYRPGLGGRNNRVLGALQKC